MRLTLLVAAALLLTAVPLLAAPTASAGCDPNVPGTCVHELPCVVGVQGQPGCIVRNPCPPQRCYPAP